MDRRGHVGQMSMKLSPQGLLTPGCVGERGQGSGPQFGCLDGLSGVLEGREHGRAWGSALGMEKGLPLSCCTE